MMERRTWSTKLFKRPTFGQWLHDYFWIDDWLGELSRAMLVEYGASEYLRCDDVFDLLASISPDLLVREIYESGVKYDGCIVTAERAIAEYKSGKGTHTTKRWGDKPIVYFIEAVGLDLVKIGYTESFETRFNTIATACPSPIKVMDYIEWWSCIDRKLERHFHNKFSHLRHHNEWFRKEGELASRSSMHEARHCHDFWDDYPHDH